MLTSLRYAAALPVLASAFDLYHQPALDVPDKAKPVVLASEITTTTLSGSNNTVAALLERSVDSTTAVSPTGIPPAISTSPDPSSNPLMAGDSAPGIFAAATITVDPQLASAISVLGTLGSPNALSVLLSALMTFPTSIVEFPRPTSTPTTTIVVVTGTGTATSPGGTFVLPSLTTTGVSSAVTPSSTGWIPTSGTGLNGATTSLATIRTTTGSETDTTTFETLTTSQSAVPSLTLSSTGSSEVVPTESSSTESASSTITENSSFSTTVTAQTADSSTLSTVTVSSSISADHTSTTTGPPDSSSTFPPAPVAPVIDAATSLQCIGRGVFGALLSVFLATNYVL